MSAITLCDYGQLPAVRVATPDGAEAIVTLYGGHLISWKTADGRERLFCSKKTALDGGRAIRGGVPVIFPQFAERGSGMRHGFARVNNWRLTESGEEGMQAWARFALAPADLVPAHAQAWPHSFVLELTVTLEGSGLELSLDVRNDGAEAFAFSSALHTYFLVDALDEARIHGVRDGELAISDKFDEIFRETEGRMSLTQPSGTLDLHQQGFSDAVVWNPGAADAAALADMDNEEYRHFVCIEPALIEPLTLAPGAAWRGWHRIDATSIP